MKSSEALKKARSRLVARKNSYVCVAIEDSGGMHTAVYKRIQNALAGNMTILGWLRINSEDYCKFQTNQTVGSKEFMAALLAYRIAWIDWMIPQYEAAGD